MERSLGEFLKTIPELRRACLTGEELQRVAAAIGDDYLVRFLVSIIRDTEEIMAIDPRLGLRQIMEIAAERIARHLNAMAATIRLFDLESMRMTSFGGYGVADFDRQATIDLHGSIAGRVVQERRSIRVPNISQDPLYKAKEKAVERGMHSLLAVPLVSPAYMERGSSILGSLQIYYGEQDKVFQELEVIHAELLARRLSFVLAKKRVVDLQELNRRKEQIVDTIFVKLSRREGIKLKDLFNLIIPELGRWFEVQSCSLFTVSEEGRHIHLDAAYPANSSYHNIGQTFTVSHHPYFEAAVCGTGKGLDTETERITSSHVLIKNARASRLLSQQLREYVETHRLHSLLLVPLRVEDEVRHLLVFYATSQKQQFTDEEIELLVFLGKEIMKASRLEFMGEVLHDFKNPAIAIAGFARRARQLLAGAGDLAAVRGKLTGYLDILAREGERLQDLALTLSGEGKEEVLDLEEIVRSRFQLNEAVIQHTGRRVKSRLEVRAKGMRVFCSRFGLERVLDNLFNNATKAVPEEGGEIEVVLSRHDGFGGIEIANTGEIDAGQLDQVRRGDVRGRGVSIITRFVQANHGAVDIHSEGGRTVFRVELPLVSGIGSR